MARKKDGEEIQDVSVFPEGYTLNAWDNDGREVSIAAQRTRADEKRIPLRQPSTRKGNLWFPIEEIPVGMQYGWFTEKLLGDPQGDNISEAYENGWDFVKQSDHPNYMVRALSNNPDNRIRRRNCILMKKPMQDYLETQKEYVEESAAKQREVSMLTEYFGNAPGDPRAQIYENSGSYTPNYVHKRG